MKILELQLTNFLPILAGIGKEHIKIDLRDSNELIHVFIGKIGSGKTYILSHLQPFATVGTLDVRNTDDPIIPEKDGKKVIIYEKDGHEYVITHDYIWSGKAHTKKSYIEKDGVELNENGNASSFKEIIELEFGIDQSFLRLIRLGPNVINFINMKATERKSYIASLLEDTELYLVLYKNWSNELRTLNTKASILMNKMQTVSAKPVEELETELEDLEDSYSLIKDKINTYTKEKLTLQAEINNYLGGMSYKELQEYSTKISSEIEDINTEILNMNAKLKLFDGYPSITDISKELGKLDHVLNTISESLHAYDDEYQNIITTLNALRDKKMMSDNENHMETLKSTYHDLMQQDEIYKAQLSGFQCDYSSTFLTGFLEDLNTMNLLINEILQYDQEMIKTLYHSDSSVIAFAKKKQETLGYRKMKLQKMINNLQFSASYEPPGKLYFPPFCPTKSCPYYTSHPYTIKKENPKKDAIQEQMEQYKNEITAIDIDLYRYSEFPLVYAKLTTLKTYWKKAQPVLLKIKALRCNDLFKILIMGQYSGWYDYNKVIDTIDLIEKRDKYYELTERIKTIKNEINELAILNNDDIDKEIQSYECKKKELEEKIEKTEICQKDTTDKLKEFNQMYVDLSEKSIYEESLKSLMNTLEKRKDTKHQLDIYHEKIQQNTQSIQTIDIKLQEVSLKEKQISEKIDLLKTTINDIKYTNEELDQVLIEQKYMTYMVDAVSSKKGIPLVMIQIFLDACRDIVNDLIYDVCEDEIEILPFQINDTEFKIPYMVNGQKIDDISKASQGQSSIVSTAMSFALIRQSGSTHYNIPLLDEMDAPLHKSDKQKFISILLKHLKEIHSEQCFVITHDNNVFDGYPTKIIMTTDENVNTDKYKNIIKL